MLYVIRSITKFHTNSHRELTKFYKFHINKCNKMNKHTKLCAKVIDKPKRKPSLHDMGRLRNLIEKSIKASKGTKMAL